MRRWRSSASASASTVRLCVQVCPTGIDIRKGLQYECIGCAACIDVCDGVMDKMSYPRGLIRYATQNGINKGWDAQAQMLAAGASGRACWSTPPS
jgi:polyferredoxin